MLEVRWTAADDPVLVPLLEDLARDYDARYAPTDGVPSSAELTRYPPEDFAAEAGGAFLALLDDALPDEHRVVAGGALRRRGRRAEVKRMWTSPSRRREGLAARVLALLEARAAELGYVGMELTTGARQPEAIAFYIRQGWHPHFDPAVQHPESAYLRFTKSVPRP